MIGLYLYLKAAAVVTTKDLKWTFLKIPKQMILSVVSLNVENVDQCIEDFIEEMEPSYEKYPKRKVIHIKEQIEALIVGISKFSMSVV